MAGLIDRYFAQTYRSEVLGMVLVDTFTPDIKRLFGSLWPRYDTLLNYPGTALDTDPEWETMDIDGAMRAAQRARPLPLMPLAVMSKTEQFGFAPGFPEDVARSSCRSGRSRRTGWCRSNRRPPTCSRLAAITTCRSAIPT
jgi:hypothetical protein